MKYRSWTDPITGEERKEWIEVNLEEAQKRDELRERVNQFINGTRTKPGFTVRDMKKATLEFVQNEIDVAVENATKPAVATLKIGDGVTGEKGPETFTTIAAINGMEFKAPFIADVRKQIVEAFKIPTEKLNAAQERSLSWTAAMQRLKNAGDIELELDFTPVPNVYGNKPQIYVGRMNGRSDLVIATTMALQVVPQNKEQQMELRRNNNGVTTLIGTKDELGYLSNALADAFSTEKRGMRETGYIVYGTGKSIRIIKQRELFRNVLLTAEYEANVRKLLNS